MYIKQTSILLREEGMLTACRQDALWPFPLPAAAYAPDANLVLFTNPREPGRQVEEGTDPVLFRGMRMHWMCGRMGNAADSYFVLGLNSWDKHSLSACFVPSTPWGVAKDAKQGRFHPLARGRSSTETLRMGLMK